ncbi:MAG TPA: DUF2877 domain-containing protein [Nocardioidaceae bacterium]|nr:DUF2877 domain-containing protein [Nocardioidaceae bacterium]
MATHEIPCAASTLLAHLLDSPVEGGGVELLEVARTSVSVHYLTGDPVVPVLCVCTSRAVLLPNSLVTGSLPAPGPLRIGDGRLTSPTATWGVRRWWQPSQPSGLPRPTGADVARLSVPAASPDVPRLALPLSPDALIGLGPGLTPAGDDVLAGALVAAYATDDPRLPAWRRTTVAALARGRTTDISRAMLHHALDGYAVPQLAAFVTALCLGHDTAAATADLLAVGHTSGGALLTGVLHTLRTDPGRLTACERTEGAA